MTTLTVAPRIALGRGTLRQKFSLGTVSGMLLALAVIAALRPAFISWNNLHGVLAQAAPLAVLACGLAVTMSMKGIDMSAAVTADLAAYLAAMMLLKGHSLITIFAVTILIGLAVGALNGILAGYLGVPAIVATLGTQLVVLSIALVVSKNGQPLMLMYVSGTTMSFLAIGSGDIAESIPIVLLIAALVVAVLWALTRRTAFGRYGEAIDTNERAAYLSAVPVRLVFAASFAVCGGAAALAGVLFLMRSGIAKPQALTPYLLMGLTAVYLGSMASGRQKITIVWTLAGVAFVALIDNGLTILGFGAPARYATNGLLILAALAAGVRRRRQS